MKRSEQLVRHEITNAIMIVGQDTVANFGLITRAIETIKDEEIDGWIVGHLRAAGSHLIDAVEEIMNSLEEGAPSETEREAAFKSMREELANAGSEHE